jgi:hypothetical protein
VNVPSIQLGVVVALATIATTGLSGCSSSDSPSATDSSSTAASGSPTTSTTASAGDAASCTKTGLAQAATAAAQAMGKDNTYVINDVQCADDWAVTGGLLSGKDNPAMGAPTSLIFQQQGQEWVGQDKQNVCGTNPTATPAPADAKIPAPLYESGCLAD